ncbi:transcriptional regulator opi1 [Saitoella coloradoensis]
MSIQSLCDPGPPSLATPRTESVWSLDDGSTAGTSYAGGGRDDDQMSFTSGVSMEDPDVRLAAEALGSLRADLDSRHTQSPATIPHSHPRSGPRHVQEEGFVSRVSTYPVVSTAVRAYEGGKNMSNVFKYGAEMVESVARPVVRPFDDILCRGLDTIERRYSQPTQPGPELAPVPATEHYRERNDYAQEYREARTPIAPTPNSSHKRKRTDDPQTSPPTSTSTNLELATIPQTSTQLTARNSPSRWQTVLVGAGGLGAAMSEESLKSLRYCLQWLRYANDHLAATISTLQSLLVSFSNVGGGTLRRGNEGAVAQSTELSRRVAVIKQDVVETLRKVVGVVSHYAGASLPEPARGRVRAYVLSLPGRWAAVAEAQDPVSQPHNHLNGLHGPSPEERSAGRVLTLAKESLDCLWGVTGIVAEVLERADEWCERLGRSRGDVPEGEGQPGMGGVRGLLMEREEKEERDGDQSMGEEEAEMKKEL